MLASQQLVIGVVEGAVDTVPGAKSLADYIEVGALLLLRLGRC